MKYHLHPRSFLQRSATANTNLITNTNNMSQYEDILKRYLITKFQFDTFYGYHRWLAKNGYPSPRERESQREQAKSFEYRPKISILIPAYKTPIHLLRECIDSVTHQTYENWEVCVVDDKSGDKDMTDVLSEYAKQFPEKFKYKARAENGHISKASNDALEMSEGEYVALLDHDDILWPNALFEIVKKLGEDKNADVVYTDEDKLEDGIVHAHPYTKPAYNKYFLMGCNYITHFAAIRSSVIRDIGGFRVGVEGAQDWDLFLRLSKRASRIVHIPKIVYSWRVIETSTAKGGFTAKPYAYEAQKKSILDLGSSYWVKTATFLLNCPLTF
jgi:glycosyltransferase involved in cell wall biosynthesis